MNKAQLLKTYVENAFSGQHSVRPGFLRITEIKSLVISNRVERFLVSALWHPESQNAEVTLPVLAQLSTLFSRRSMGMKELHPSSLVGATIQVKSVTPYEAEFDGRRYTSIYAHWEIIDFGTVGQTAAATCYDPQDILDQKPNHDQDYYY